MTDTTAIQDRIRGAVPPWGRSRCPASPPPDTEMPWRLSWKCWSRRPRTAGSGASAGCAPPPGRRQARPGRPSSTTGCPWRCDGSWTSLADGGFVDRGVNVLAFGLPGTGKTHARCALGHRLVEAGHSVLFALAYRLVQELLAAKRDLALPRQLRKLEQLRLPAPRRPRLPAPGRRGVRGALHPHRRALRTEVPGHHVKPGLLGVGAHLRQPHGHRGGHRPGGASLGHPGILTSPATGPTLPNNGATIRR